MAQATLKLADDTTRKPTQRFTFTQKAIEALNPPASGRRYVYDDRQPGLALAIQSTGHRSYYLYRKGRNGRPVRLKLANYGDLSIPQARDRVKEMTGELVKGVDLVKQRRDERDAQAEIKTIKGAWEHYRDDYLKPNKSALTVRNDGYYFAALPWKSRRLDSITIDDVKRLHESISKRGKTTANRVIQFLRRLYNYAADELSYTGPNPVKLRAASTLRRDRTRGKSIALAQEQSRERFLEKSEAPQFFKAVDDEPDADFADFVRLLIYTAARRGNVGGMRWADINLTREIWTIPANQAKSRRDIIVPLSSYAKKILKSRKAKAADDAVFVFPAKRGKAGHLVEPKKKWWELRKRAGVPDLKMHDLRRTVATWATTAGTPYPTVQGMLGHCVEGVTGVYARVDVEAVRDAFEKTTAALLAAAKPKKQTKKGGK